MAAITSDGDINRVLQATRLLLRVEKTFFERKFGQASTIRRKSYRLMLRKKIIALQITMLSIIEEEKDNSAVARECEKCGLSSIDSLHFCGSPENVSTPVQARRYKRQLGVLPEWTDSNNDADDEEVVIKKEEMNINDDPIITARIHYGDNDELVTCMECGKFWDGFAQHRCFIDE